MWDVAVKYGLKTNNLLLKGTYVFLFFFPGIAQQDEEEEEEEEEEEDENEEEEDDEEEAEEKNLKKMEEQRSHGKVRNMFALLFFVFLLIKHLGILWHVPLSAF